MKFAKQELSARSLPTIRFFPVGTPEKKKATKVLFPADIEFEEISKDIQDLIDDKSININEQELQFHLQGGLQENKVLIILFYNTPAVSLTFRVVSQLSQFQSKFRFLSFKNAPEQVL